MALLLACVHSRAGNTLALGPSTRIMGVLHVNIHTWLYFKNDFYMPVVECGMLLSSSFLQPVTDYRNSFKMTQIVNYHLVTPMREQQIPSPCLLGYSSLVQNFNGVPLVFLFYVFCFFPKVEQTLVVKLQKVIFSPQGSGEHTPSQRRR